MQRRRSAGCRRTQGAALMLKCFVAIVAILIIALAVVFGIGLLPVRAAGANGCETIGTIGNIIVARCEDEETGAVIYGNSAGFMDVVE
jgi:hypothetical protein